jgi:hypothetical protein
VSASRRGIAMTPFHYSLLDAEVSALAAAAVERAVAP